MARLSFRCDDELVERVDRARGMVARERFLRELVSAMLPVFAGGQSVDLMPGSRSPLSPADVDRVAAERRRMAASAGTAPAAGLVPGETFATRRPSSQAKSNVRPIPKGPPA